MIDNFGTMKLEHLKDKTRNPSLIFDESKGEKCDVSCKLLQNAQQGIHAQGLGTSEVSKVGLGFSQGIHKERKAVEYDRSHR